jgi:acetate kinase
MNIFVINQGSSSIKCSLYFFDQLPKSYEKPLWEAKLEWKNRFEDLFFIVEKIGGTKQELKLDFSSEEALWDDIFHALTSKESGALSSLEEIDVIGHRIVHGGGEFTKSVLVKGEVLEKIDTFSKLAPLHNLSEISTIRLLEKKLPNVLQIAVFDTAFHHTLSQVASIYPVPYEWYQKGIRRYGFHGISFQYCLKRLKSLSRKDPDSLKIMICHLGSGASLCAIKEGKSIDTTMGFTPLEGLMMDTRSGSIDPGIVLHLLREKSPEELTKDLYERSGLLGVSGSSSDMRDIVAKSLEGDVRSTLAFNLYENRLKSLIGSMVASLEGIDLLVFTGGIGENTPLLRSNIARAFSFLGMRIDSAKNEEVSKEDRVLSTKDSKVEIVLIHTREDFEIARECFLLVGSQIKGKE